MAMAIYGVAVVVAPILGPTLGGYITDNYSLAVDLLHQHPGRDPLAGHDPASSSRTRRGWTRKSEDVEEGIDVDYVGLSLISLTLGSLEVLYAKGQEWDWFGDPYAGSRRSPRSCWSPGSPSSPGS